MSAILSDPSALASILGMLTKPDTATIKHAEKLLKPILKDPLCIRALLVQITTPGNDEAVRLQAALLLKRKSGHYVKFNSSDKAELRKQYLHAMVSEPVKVTGIALAGAVALLAKFIFSAKDGSGSWPEMFGLIMNLAQDPSERLKILNYKLLSQLAENISTSLKPHTTTLCQMFVMGCQDPSTEVASAAMEATVKYVSAIANDKIVMEMEPVLTPLFTVLAAHVEKGDTDIVAEGLDLIEQCCTMEFPLINDHVEALVPFLINIIQSSAAENAVKQAAGNAFMVLIEQRPKLIAKKQLIPPCIQAMVSIIARSTKSSAGALFSYTTEETGDDDDDDDGELDLQRIAQTCLDTMAITIPSKYFVEPALAICAQCMASPDPQMRKAACATLGVISEGCKDTLRTILPSILPALIESVKSPDVCVRECACFALGQFSEHLQPEILRHHMTILPTIFQALDDPTLTVQGTSCYVLEMFCESLQPETLRPFLGHLMQKLIILAQNPQKTVREMAMCTIAATAVAAEADFIPYAEGTIGVLSPMLADTEPVNFAMRGRALECLGHVAIAIGEHHYAPYFSTGLQYAIQGTQLNDATLKEFSYVYIANCAKAMKTAFNPILPTLMPHLLEVIGESEMYIVDSDEEDDEPAAHTISLPPVDGAADDDASDIELDYNVEEGFVLGKKAALSAIGSLALYTKEAFFPFLDESMKIILEEDIGCVYSIHQSIRTEAIEIIQHFVSVAKDYEGLKDVKPVKNVALQFRGPILPEVTASIIAVLLKIIAEDDDKRPVSTALDSLVGIIEELGVAALMLQVDIAMSDDKLPNIQGGVAEKLMEAIYKLLNEETPCQKKNEKEDDEDDDHDTLVNDSVSDLIGVVAKAIGPSIVPFFDHFVDRLAKFTSPNRPHSDRSMAIGCFAEVLLEIGPDARKYLELIVPACQLGLTDGIEGLRRNSAFCIGAIAESIGSGISTAQVQSFLQMLYPLCIRDASSTLSSDMGGADIDNSISAVCRMIIHVPGTVPLPQVLPVMLAALPLQADELETQMVYSCLVRLVDSMEPTILGLFPQVLRVLGSCLTGPLKLKDETRAIIITALKSYASSPQYQGIFNTAIQQVEDQAAVMSIHQVLNS